MDKWVREKINDLFSRVSEEIGNTIENPTEDHVHDLRTSIRRTRESLSVFEDFFAAGDARKVRKRLQEVMHLAAEIRNRDVALSLLAGSKVVSVKLKRTLEAQREHYREQLIEELKDIRKRDLETDWKESLGL